MRALALRAARWAGFGLLAFGLLGMGSFGGGDRGVLPPADFHATLTDADGVHIDVSHLTMGGDATLEGDLGRGKMRVPFDTITQIRLEPIGQERDRVRAEVNLRSEQPVVLTLRGSATFYGQTPSGAYQIRARDLRAVDFAKK
ncbi:MAG TPA: hypothetical protein VKW76_03060 [Candidatus Binatia bacterium]|nr:hypothetical protein [Candidatus Binatia bacterium]